MAMGSEATILFDVGMIILSATVLAVAAKFLKQPLLAAYILAGIIIGPQVLGVVQNTGVIQMFAELGVAFLLFVVGLELEISRLQEVRNVVLGVTLSQVALLFALGFFVTYFAGFAALPSIYMGLFVAFSSTAVLVKLLSDRGDLDTLHGRIILGILLIQDVLVVLSLSLLSTFNNFTVELLVSSMLKGAGMLALAIVISKYIAPHFLRLIDDSHDLIFLTSISVLFLFVGMSVEAGLSTAVGGFLAGIALTAFPYNVEIAERARTLRDFFVTIFFVSLGMLVSLESLAQNLVPFLVLLAIVLLVKPFIITLMTSFFRYGKRTSFYTGLSLSQISEFAMVLALTGLTMGHIGRDVFSIVTALMVTTIVVTTYLLEYQKDLYEIVERYILEFEGSRYEEEETALEGHIVLCGGHIKGRKILRLLEDRDEQVVVVDYDPEVISVVEEHDARPIYGDIEDAQTLERANVAEAKTVISTVPDEDDNRYLLNYVKDHNPDAVVIVSADDIESALLLYEEGADYVLYPKMLAAKEATFMVARLYSDGEDLQDARQHHIEELEEELEEEIIKRFEPEFVKKLKDRMQRVREGGREGG